MMKPHTNTNVVAIVDANTYIAIETGTNTNTDTDRKRHASWAMRHVSWVMVTASRLHAAIRMHTIYQKMGSLPFG
jgi:hypothetical protein